MSAEVRAAVLSGSVSGREQFVNKLHDLGRDAPLHEFIQSKALDSLLQVMGAEKAEAIVRLALSMRQWTIQYPDPTVLEYKHSEDWHFFKNAPSDVRYLMRRLAEPQRSELERVLSTIERNKRAAFSQGQMPPFLELEWGDVPLTSASAPRRSAEQGRSSWRGRILRGLRAEISYFDRLEKPYATLAALANLAGVGEFSGVQVRSILLKGRT
jgi:hypothetical protein